MASRIVTLLPNTEFTVATGNYDESRVAIDRVIIHTTVCSAQAAMNRFGTYGTQVSAHYIIGLDGKIYHGLEETFTAYHAGSYSMNQRSIGIEHEDNGDYNGVRPDTLYSTSAKLVNDICKFYNIPIDRQHILKHSEVIATGCPDALDIDRIVREAQALNKPDTCPQERDKNWTCFVTVLQALSVWANPNDKDGSVQNSINAVKGYQDHVQTLQNTIQTQNGQISNLQGTIKQLNDTITNLKNTQVSIPVTDYKPYLLQIKEVLNGLSKW